MTKTQRNAFYHVRAVQLALVYLTRRNDLGIQDGTESLGVDLIVSLRKDGQDEGKIFGVDVTASDTPDEQPSPHRSAHHRNLPMPLCAFHFSMRDDKGTWYWIKEPLQNGELAASQDAPVKPLNNETIAEMVRQVRDWYEQRR